MGVNSGYYKFLNIVRLYCALLIIPIHMGLRNVCSIVPCMSDQGVPFFFMVSGFFFSQKLKKCENIKQATVSYIKPILIVYLVWIALWTPSMIIEYSQLYTGSPIYLIAVLCRRFFLAGLAPYWYLLVLAEGAAVLALIINRKNRLLGWALFAGGLILSIIYIFQAANNPNGLIYKTFFYVFSWENNVIMRGFPLMYLGFVIESHEKQVRKMNFWVLLALYALSVASAFLLFQTRENLYYIPFGIIQAVLLFLICLTSIPRQEHISQNASTHARNLSSVIYLTHSVFLSILGYGFHLWDSGPRYILTVLGALLLYLVAIKVKCRPLNRLFMIKEIG